MNDTAAWCDSCNRLIEADQVVEGAGGNRVCPVCDAPLDQAPEEPDADAPPKAPWHFKVLLVGTVGYLVYRVIWFIGWLHHHA